MRPVQLNSTNTTGRKRSQRGPDRNDNPLLLPTGPIDRRDLVSVRIREYMALAALIRGSATRADVRDMLVSAAIARELKRVGYGGHDYLCLLDAVDRVLAGLKGQLKLCSCIGVTGPGANVLRWLLEFHQAQREAATVRDYHGALVRVARQPGRYGAWLA